MVLFLSKNVKTLFYNRTNDSCDIQLERKSKLLRMERCHITSIVHIVIWNNNNPRLIQEIKFFFSMIIKLRESKLFKISRFSIFPELIVAYFNIFISEAKYYNEMFYFCVCQLSIITNKRTFSRLLITLRLCTKFILFTNID